MSNCSSSKGGECLSGVCCDACNCIYHTPGNNCKAARISVENENAEMKVETFCSTFTPKDGCC